MLTPEMTVETTALTYAELGERLGITQASAKRLANRRKWTKRPGNDGLSRVQVPLDYFAARDDAKDAPEEDTEVDAEVATSEGPGDATADVTYHVTVLVQHIERLEKALADTKAEAEVREGRERARADAERAKVETLQAEMLRAAAEAMMSERARGELEARLRAAEEQVETLRGRGWRLFRRRA